VVLCADARALVDILASDQAHALITTRPDQFAERNREHRHTSRHFRQTAAP
jgi:hypothetical protein